MSRKKLYENTTRKHYTTTSHETRHATRPGNMTRKHRTKIDTENKTQTSGNTTRKHRTKSDTNKLHEQNTRTNKRNDCPFETASIKGK